MNHGLKVKKVHRVTELNQEVWLKPYVDANKELRTKSKNDFKKDIFKLMNNSMFEKTMENIKKHGDIKHVPAGKRMCCLVSEPKYHTTNGFSENLLVRDINKKEEKMNKSMYVGLSVLNIS